MRCLLELDAVALVTITAPGEDAGLVWDRAHCSHPEDDRCSGPKGCRVVAGAADAWNDQAGRSWGQLHRVAAQIARRCCGPGPLIAAKVWEVQERGVLHLHLVVPSAAGIERARVDAYVAALEQHGTRHGFGFVSVRHRFDGKASGARAAGYCAKYVGKAAGAEMTLARPIYVGAFLTQAVGLTMRLLRWRRYLHRLWGFRPGGDELRPLVLLKQAFPSLEYLGTTVQPSGPWSRACPPERSKWARAGESQRRCIAENVGMAASQDPFGSARKLVEAWRKQLAPLSDPKLMEAFRKQAEPLSDPKLMEALRKQAEPLSDPKLMEALRKQAEPLSDPKLMEALRVQAQPLWDPKTLEALRKQLAPLSDPKLMDALRRQAEPLWDPKTLEALQKQLAAEFDELSERIEEWDDAAEAAVESAEELEELEIGAEEDFGWVDLLPEAAQLRLLVSTLGVLNALLILMATAAASLPLTLGLAAAALLRLAEVLLDRLERRSGDDGE